MFVDDVEFFEKNVGKNVVGGNVYSLWMLLSVEVREWEKKGSEHPEQCR